MEYISKSERATQKLAKRFSKTLKAGDVVLLEGDLGSGKTVFAKGLAKGLKIKDTVVSPTFTIYNHYANKKFDLYHFDMYRIEDFEEISNLGIDEILDSDAIKVIEWPDIIRELLPKQCYQVKITKNDTDRKIEIGIVK